VPDPVQVLMVMVTVGAGFGLAEAFLEREAPDLPGDTDGLEEDMDGVMAEDTDGLEEDIDEVGGNLNQT